MNDPFASLAERFHLVTNPHTVGPHQFLMRHPRSVDELIDEEKFDEDERLPYWADIWPSSSILAARIAEETGEVDGRARRLLELGCGVGLPAMVAARLGFEAVATDYTPEAVEFVAANAQSNGLERVTARMVDWRNLPTDLGLFDIVCAADVLYEKHMPGLVAMVLDRTLTPHGLGIVTDPQRRLAPTFPVACTELKLNCKLVEARPAKYGDVPLKVDIYEVRRVNAS